MDPFTLALTLATQVDKGVAGYYQGRKAEKLGVQDTTTPAEREALQLARQRASAQLPGQGAALNRIEAGTNDTLAAATRAGTSSSSVLGLLGLADQNRQRALNDLGTRADVAHQQQERDLGVELQRKAQHELRDRETFERSKAALNESSERNIYGALEGAAQVGAYALNPVAGAKTATDLPADGSGAGLSPYGPDAANPLDPYGRRRPGYNQYGLYDPTGGLY